VKLYVRRVFIMDDAEMFLPRYLRFVRGVVDSDDLDLNVSRESLQENRVVSAMKKTATNRVLDMLEEMAEDPETYQTFWNEFGNLLKEGAVEDHARRERLSGLLRFATTHTDQPDQTVSLDDYIERMGDEQEKIYYVTADSFASAKSSPHLEVFRDKDIEVLLMYDRIDEWLANHLAEYKDHELQSVAVGDLDIDDVGDQEDDDLDSTDEEHAELIRALQTSLGERVQQVRTTRRLRDSPACLVAQEGGMSKHFERMLRDAGQQVPDRKPILEVNPDHPIIERLGERVEEGEDVGEWADVLFDQAWLSEGGQLDDPGTFVQRMNKLMIRLLGEGDSDIITDV
jgi:molecular chaperone HtpG